ncbi:MAG: DUF4238 domain-containing protein [Nitratireductor rhodophyticola]|uniref:DUF4238 domain-containing protein n=1 Tax=Nitratireductor rhodophyticola TaxID=2854036 RepID=UPI0032D970DB
MSNGKPNQQYRHNHYVPEWYQRRFMLPGQHKYWYLDLKPERQTSGGVTFTRRDRLHWGPERCFAQNDLYTTQWGDIVNTEIEQFFFGSLDSEGKKAAEYFGGFKHPSANGAMLETLISYMSAQKLRTPKGLATLQSMTRLGNRNLTLMLLQHMRNIYCAIWTECVWQIADATDSPTKFIISDHPVTVYNRECFPMSRWCRDHNDPDIRCHATHTYFPLSLDRVLTLTNLSWVRNPYQDALDFRPNSRYFRQPIFNFRAIQTDRILSEQEVREINWVTKQRAYRYVAAAEKEWLYPERYLNNPHWRKLGGGYLFMPDPRHIHMGGEILIGYESGKSDAFSEYGHKPWDRDYKNEKRDRKDGAALERFQAEWASMMGRRYRGISYEFYSEDHPPPAEESGEIHAHHLKIDRRNRQRPGERPRRRRLIR